MPQIQLIHGLELVDWTDNGRDLLAARDTGDGNVKVHFQQGDLDGACGPYALLSALSVAGWAPEEDRHFHKALRKVIGPDVLMDKGTSPGQLKKLLQKLGAPLSLKQIRQGDSAEMLRSLRRSLDDHIPVLLLLEDTPRSEESPHWVTAIGYEVPHSAEDDPSEGANDGPERIYLLDPAAPPPVLTYWNALLTRTSKRGRVTYQFWADRGMETVEIASAYRLVGED